MKPRFYAKYLDEFYDFQEKLNINDSPHISRLYMVISLKIAIVYFDQSKEVSFEYLCEKNPKKIGKRTTIQSILKEGLMKKFFIKTINYRVLVF